MDCPTPTSASDADRTLTMAHRADPDQEAILASDGRHIIVIAPPGTGKTALAARIAGRHAGELSLHERVLLLTFSNQARGQLEREVRRAVSGPERLRIEVSNYHSFFWQAVGAYRRALGLPEELRMTTWRRRQSILRGADARAVDLLERQRHLLEAFAEQAHPEVSIPTGLEEARVRRLLDAVSSEHLRGNLVFDDLGALFWTLISSFPTVRQAFRSRYPVLIADEHQDASLLQDALVGELGGRHRIVLADPMQLIHGWRGADERRLQAHRDVCDREFALLTPHRWHGDPTAGEWLLGVRKRLSGERDASPPPSGARVVLTDAAHGENGMLAASRFRVHEFLRSGCQSVAVLARTGREVVRVRDHLTAHGLRPRQLGATEVFENGLALAEDLPGLDARGLVDRAVEVIFAALPTVPAAVRHQVHGRLGATGSRKTGSGAEARIVLEAVDAIYLNGAPSFFVAIVAACDGLQAAGHHLPRPDEYSLYTRVHQSGIRDSQEQIELFTRELTALSRRSLQRESGVLTMTVHQAKGREFDGVILFGATSRNFSASEEDKRTFYVAITRGVRRWAIVASEGSQSELINALLPD